MSAALLLRQARLASSTNALSKSMAAASSARWMCSESKPDSSSNPPAESSQESKDIAQLPQREVTTADVISGAPRELRHRVVRIFQPSRNTMQSGTGKMERWRIDWDILPGGGRWENPLMGWASSADYMQGTRITFKSKEDAVHFAEKQGWDYYVQPPPAKRIPPKNYAENYVYKPHKLRIARTK